MRKNVCLYFFVALAVLLYLSSAALCAQSEIPFDKAVHVLQSLEAEVKTLEWDVDIKKYQIRNDNELDSGFSRKSHVIYDPKGHLFCASISGTSTALGGNNANLLSEIGVSFDGEKYMAWRRAVEKNVKGSPAPFGLGVVSKSESDVTQIYDIKRLMGMDFGAVTGLPLVFVNSYKKEVTPVFISEYLKTSKRENTACRIYENESGIWQIKTKGLFASMEFDVEILIDINRGGIITKYEWSQTQKGEKHILLSYDIQTIKNTDNCWVPSVITIQEYPGPNVTNKTILTFSNVHIHKKISETNHFSLDFPEGIQVTDYESKKIYKIGDPLDADKAVSDFMTRHGLTGDIPTKIHRGYILRYVLIGTGLLLIGIAVYQMAQKRRKE